MKPRPGTAGSSTFMFWWQLEHLLQTETYWEPIRMLMMSFPLLDLGPDESVQVLRGVVNETNCISMTMKPL